jgi:arylsulfatase A-like enzyme
MKERILRAAAYGAAAWLVYCLIEAAAAIGTQVTQTRLTSLFVWQWHLLAMLIGVSIAIGVLLCAAAATPSVLTHRTRRIDNPWLVPGFTILLVYTFNIVHSTPLSNAAYIALGVSLALVSTFFGALVSESWSEQVRFLTNPVVLGFLLSVGPSTSQLLVGKRSMAIKGVLILAAYAAIISAAAAWNRVRPRAPILRKRAIVMGLLVLATGTVKSALSGEKEFAYTAPAPAGKPNVILITMDTVRADHLSLYGYERKTTPYLSDLARGATLYTRAIATSDYSLPTHASIFTGMYPDWHKAMFSASSPPRESGLRSDLPTLAEVLQSNGYWTAEAAANFPYLASTFDLTRGFAVSDVRQSVRLHGFDNGFCVLEVARQLLGLFIDGGEFGRTYRRASDITELGNGLIDQAKAKGRHFFLFLNYMDAHAPYAPERPFNRIFPGSELRARPSAIANPPFTLHHLNNYSTNLPSAQRAYLISQYDGGIAAIDAAIKTLIQHLEELGLYDNTLIIITADHGEGLLERGMVDHLLATVYQTHLHIPLLIKYPGQHIAAKSGALLSQVDLMPTVLENAGIKAPQGLQGRSLSHEPAGTDDVFAVSRATMKRNAQVRGTRRAIFSGSLKLITWTAGAPELYDLASDPAERNNLYSPNDPRVIDLSERLARLVNAIPSEEMPPSNPDPATLERLKSLGYVQ